MTANEAGNARMRHAQEQAAKAEKRRDPESEFYDTVKKKFVTVELQSGKIVKGKLAWVATYSIGIEQDMAREACLPGPPILRPVLIMKGAISTLHEG